MNGSTPDSLARAGVCTIPEGRGIFPNLTVRENLQMVTYASASLRAIEERSYERFPILAERRRNWPAPCPGASSRCSRSPGLSPSNRPC